MVVCWPTRKVEKETIRTSRQHARIDASTLERLGNALHAWACVCLLRVRNHSLFPLQIQTKTFPICTLDIQWGSSWGSSWCELKQSEGWSMSIDATRLTIDHHSHLWMGVVYPYRNHPSRDFQFYTYREPLEFSRCKQIPTGTLTASIQFETSAQKKKRHPNWWSMVTPTDSFSWGIQR